MQYIKRLLAMPLSVALCSAALGAEKPRDGVYATPGRDAICSVRTLADTRMPYVLCQGEANNTIYIISVIKDELQAFSEAIKIGDEFLRSDFNVIDAKYHKIYLRHNANRERMQVKKDGEKAKNAKKAYEKISSIAIKPENLLVD